MKALIVCHAGVGVGLGHLTRSLVIAKILRARFGADVRFLIQGDPLERDDLETFFYQFVPSDCDIFGLIASQSFVDLVLFDFQPQRVPKTLGATISALRVAGSKVVAIDGLLAYRHELDLIFIPSFHFRPPFDLNEGAPIVFGWDCFLFDPQWEPVPWVPGRRVLALSGGSDATQLGNTWPALLNQSLREGTELHWVKGPFAAKPNWPATTRIKMIEHSAPAGLGPLMLQASYAITVFGVSFYELLHMGVPTVVFSPYGDKDAIELDSIAASGVALVAADEREATERLIELMNCDGLAQQLSGRAREAMGESGAFRLCAEIENLMQTTS